MIREDESVRLHCLLHTPLQVGIAIFEQESHSVCVS